MSQPFDEQPPTPAGAQPQQPFGAPPPPPLPPQPGYGPPRPGPGSGQPAAGNGQPQPVAGNPYAQPVQDTPPQGYGYGAQPTPYGSGQAPHGPYGNGQAPDGPYGNGQGPHGPYGSPGGFPSPQPGTPAPRKRTALIAVAAVLAVAVIGGGVWFAVGRGSDSGSDDAKSPASVGTPSASGAEGSAGESPAVTDPTTDPAGEPSASPPARSDNPFVPQPTGTGLQAVWKKRDSTMLALGDAYTDEPARVNAILSDGDGFACKGRWQKDGSGGLEVGLLCEQDGARVESKDRFGELRQNGDTLTVTWKKGATGADTFERFQDMEPA
ncbi:hypothetical protein [Streptomyces sp. NPDC048142]|uniref:hypothetical protein n=1 Tax=Streptomyces sp. NPDC048142 TaxID=3365501 RepID=UPI003718EECF